MQAVTIHDMRTSDSGSQFLAVDLIDVLRTIEPLAAESQWQASGIWCITRGNTEEPVFEDRLDWSKLIAFAEECYQVIDGEFRAFQPDSGSSWLAIVADDSTYYVVLCDDNQVIKAIRERFNDVRDSDNWAENFVV